MSEHIHRKADEGEDDDLELLRIAALKSINPKKDQPLQYHRSPPSRTPNTHSPQKISSAYSNIPVKQSGNVVNQDNGHMLNVSAQPYYPSPVRNLPMSQSRSIHANVDNFAARQRLEQLDLNEPYVPQRVSGMPPVVPPPHVAPNGVGWMPDPAAMVGTNYTPFPSQKVSDSMPVGVKVQLSPRSMAFVAQNNDILMRRKGENISPNYAYRSPSPPYRSTSPGRWSKSPSPQPKAVSRSPGHRARMHHYVPHRRSVSRSPPPNNHTRSPLPRCRSISRSPLLHQGGPHMSRHQSPNPFHTYSPRSPLAMRQMKLRSPPMHNAKHKASPQRRRISRSPLAHNGRLHSRSPQLPPNGRRSPALLPRQNNRGRRSLSPPHNRKRSPQGPHFHDQGNLPPRYHPNRDRRSPVQLNIRRRSASPLPPLPRHRSHSRSPQRRLPRRSRERNMGVNPLPRRRSPHLLNRRRYEPPTNGFRNNPRARKRSLSPGMKDRPIRRSRTRSLDRNRRINKRPRRSEPEERRGGGGLDDFNRNESRRHDERGVRQNQNQSSSRRDRDEVESKRKEINGTASVMSNETVVTPVEEKGTKQVDLLARNEVIKEPSKPDTKMSESHSNNAMDIEKQESSDDEEDNDDDDGIDLFASEDSESENEGRFKSSSNKNERKTQAPTVSFAKLGETRSVEVKELADMSANGNRDRERDRNRDRPERSRNNYPGRARGGGGGGIADHQRGVDNARLSRERDRRNKVNVRNGSKNRRDRDRDRERERDKERERERERDRGDRGERGQHVERADRVDRSNRDWDAPLTKGVDDKKASSVTEKPMFKATFQALENEGKTSRKNSRDRDTTDRKTASNRRRNNSKDRRASPDHESGHTATSSTSGNGPSTANATANSTSSRPSSPSSRGLSDAGASSSSKKPIHLRLGAKTNTFKSAKKTPTSPWSGTSHNNNGSGNSNSSKNASTEKV